ncbi:MAG: beta-galactosidase [Deltaproteobacteria bacterium]|nr:beta-galactosidase [Deltaproteobacteria bacterium]
MKIYLFLTTLILISCSDKTTENNNPNNTNSNNNTLNNNTNNNTQTDEPSNNQITGIYESFEITPNSFIINGKPVILRGGTLQWQRLPPGEWEDRIKKFRAAGFNTIDMYVAWNLIETSEGTFNFSNPDMGRFLDLVKKYGLFVYLRPGPYICNEMDGGGIPAWMVTKSTKKTKDSDGLINFRTDDPDYLLKVENYYHSLNEFIKPWLITNNGPIILYSLENEYNWFETFAGIDKLFWYEGSAERDVFQDVSTQIYLETLKDYAISDGIDIPLTTCPGDSKVSGTGNAAGIIPMPNMYKYGQTEKYAFDTLSSMHNPDNFNNAYTMYPTGTTESERKATRMLRTIMGGMDAFFAFNFAGLHQEGNINALVLNNAGLQSVVDTSPENVLDLFVSPTIGYFHNVVDYYGAISAMGVLREKFFHFRRANMFLETVQEIIAPLEYPERSGAFDDSNPDLTIDSTLIGALEDEARVNYWFDTDSPVIQLLNETGQNVILKQGSINFRGKIIPAYTDLTIGVEKYPGANPGGSTEINSTDSPEELHYSHMMVFSLPLTKNLIMDYSTSEILTLRDFNDEKLLIIYGKNLSEGEFKINGDFSIIHSDENIDAHYENGEIVFTYIHEEIKNLILEDSDGKRLKIIITDREHAGKTWFFKFKNKDVLISPVRYLELENNSSLSLDIKIQYTANIDKIHVFSSKKLNIPALETLVEYDEITENSVYKLPVVNISDPEIEFENNTCADDWIDNGSGVYPSRTINYTGEPIPLESFNIYKGTTWISGHFNLPQAPSHGSLYVENASDIIGIYVNGNYITTVAPVGTEIDNKNLDPAYRFTDLAPFLKSGINTVAFRTTIWGHGSFMWPRGTLTLSNAKLPALGFDSVKGIFGSVRINDTEIIDWKITHGLEGENGEFYNQSLPNGVFCNGPVLSKGSISWFQTEFNYSGSDIPISLHLKGTHLLAKIWLNGNLIGRWISDEGFISKGTWSRSIRNMWMNTSPDNFPLAFSRLKYGTNKLTIVFMDCSDEDENPSLDSMEIIYSPEEKSNIEGITVNSPVFEKILVFSISSDV